MNSAKEQKSKSQIIDSDEEITEESNIYYKDTYVYGWGKNAYGELGTFNKDNTFIPTPIKSFQEQIIKSISSGGKHSVIITDQGKVFICGSNMFGLLGNDNPNQKYHNRFQRMGLLDNEFITQVACAEFHSLCLNEEGTVFAWGGNLHNKLGQIGGIMGSPIKIPSLSNKKIVEISCGDYHSCALSNNGELYSWGGGGSYNRGQCGQGSLADIDQPKKISFFKDQKVKKVSCGGYHTIVLCENGNLYGFGKGSYGQCGYGSSEDTSTPKLIKFNVKTSLYEKSNVKKDEINNISTINKDKKDDNFNSNMIIKDIKCGGEHTILLSSNGRVYTFGHGYTGQLGLGGNKNIDKPLIVMSLISKTANQIAAGWSHSLILLSDGNLYVAGCGKYGELGLSNQDNLNRYNFTLIKSASKLNITNIFAGGHHSWLVTDNISPEKMDFEMPSPLDSPNFSILQPKENPSAFNLNSTQKKDSNEAEEQNEDKEEGQLNESGNANDSNDVNCNHKHRKLSRAGSNKIAFNLDMLNDNLTSMMTNKIQIRIAYTDLQLSHRFVRFEIPTDNKNASYSYQELDAMFKDFISKDSGNILYRLQDDTEVLELKEDEMSSSSPVMDILFNEMKNYQIYQGATNNKTYSLSIIYDYNRNPILKQMLTVNEANKQNSNKKDNSNPNTPFSLVIYSEDDIATEENENVLSNWIFELYGKFADFFKDGNDDIVFPRYFELRPNCFAS